MVDYRLYGRLLHGLSDPTRLQILGVLFEGEQRPTDVVEATGLAQPNVSKHLSCLLGCGLVVREKRGREAFYRPLDGLEEVFGALDGVLSQAGQTLESCTLTDATIGTPAARREAAA